MVPEPKPEWWPEHLEIESSVVDVSQLVVPLQMFLASAAAVHYSMFRLPLIITSANDGNHAHDSKHYLWKAVDIRSRDLTSDQEDIFARSLVGMQRIPQVGIFDERYIGQPHWHVEAA